MTRNVKTPRFQQRHYEAIAEVMAKSALETNAYAIATCAKQFAAMLKADNPKFNPSKFYNACGLGNATPHPSS